jgi:hypothetical protein
MPEAGDGTVPTPGVLHHNLDDNCTLSIHVHGKQANINQSAAVFDPKTVSVAVIIRTNLILVNTDSDLTNRIRFPIGSTIFLFAAGTRIDLIIIYLSDHWIPEFCVWTAKRPKRESESVLGGLRVFCYVCFGIWCLSKGKGNIYILLHLYYR